METEVLIQSPPAQPRHSPEYVDASGLYEMFGIRRGTAYNLLWDGLIQSTVLKRPGKKSGRRLFNVASVRKYLNSQVGLHDHKGDDARD